jgi:predicted HTH transcriptional regulator
MDNKYPFSIGYSQQVIHFGRRVFIYRSDMKVTSIKTVKVENTPLTEQGKLVYETILRTGARTTKELAEHLDMSEGEINLMIAHMLRHDLAEVKVR